MKSLVGLFALLAVLLTTPSCQTRWEGATYAVKEAVIVSTPVDNTARLTGVTCIDKETVMALLSVALEDGFVDDLVAVRVNDREVFRQPNVKTRFQIGLADSFEVNTPEGSVKVEVILPSKQLSESIVLEVSDRAYIGVSLTPEGKISYRVSQEPFGYL
jgi:hypothetical protein